MKCPACQSENPSDSQYCHKCGSPVEEALSETLSYSPAEETAVRGAFRFSPGEKFGDRYTIIEEIGRGGMGRVYKAEDHELGITVVLKMIRPELSSRPHMVDQFRRETLLGRSISHENVVRIHDLGAVNEIRYISMDFIKGENLSELIHTSGSLTLATCVQIALQICRALKAAHQKGIIHRDLKPQNVMIDNTGKAYVTDFGLAASLSAPRTGPSRRILGTPRYLSPEQARGEEPDQRSDIYSLGIVLYEMTTGGAPFKADTAGGYIRDHITEKPIPPSKANPSVPPALEKVILKCLEKKKEERYQSVDELIRDLEIQKSKVCVERARPGATAWRKALKVSALTLLLGVAGYGLLKMIVKPAPPRARNLVAIMYAVNNSGDSSLDAKLRWVIPYLLGSELAQSRYLSVLPQDSLMQVLADMDQTDEARHLSGTLDRIADAVNVEYFVLPSFTTVGDGFMINFLVRKARTNAILGEPDSVKGRWPEDLQVLMGELSMKVKSKLNFSPADIAADSPGKPGRMAPASLEAVRYYVEAERSYVDGDFASSVELLEKAIQEDADNALAYLLMAKSYDYLGEVEKAELQLRKALDLADRVSEKDSLIIRGYAASVLDESPTQAIEWHRKLIELDPKDQSSYINLGAIWRNLEEWDLAGEQFDKALMINPRNSLALESKAYIDACRGRYPSALEITRAGMTAFPNNLFFVRNLPLLYLIMGDYSQASAELEKALARMPDSSDMVAFEGHLCALKGDLASARQIYERLRFREEPAGARPSSLRGRFWLARLQLWHGEYEQVRKGVLEGIELARKNDRIYDELSYRLLLGYAELQTRRYARAEDALKPALEISQRARILDGQRFALHLMGMIALGEGRVDEAKRISLRLRHFIERTRLSKQQRNYHHLMGHIALAEGQPLRAVRDFEQALRLLPGQVSTGDEQAFFYDGLAAAFYRSGDWPKAIETYKRIIALTTGRLRWGDIYARSHYWLGKSHQRTGDRTEAAAYYTRFLQLWDKADHGMPEVADAQEQLGSLAKAR